MRGCSRSRGGIKDDITAEQYQLQRKRGVNKGIRGRFPLDTIYYVDHKEGNGIYFTPETWSVVSPTVSVGKQEACMRKLSKQQTSRTGSDVRFGGRVKTLRSCGSYFGSRIYPWLMVVSCRCPAAECTCTSSERRPVMFAMHANLEALPEGRQPWLSSEQLVPLRVPLKREHFLPVPI